MQNFYIAVMHCTTLEMLVRICAERIPQVGEEVEINLGDRSTYVELIDSGDEGPVKAWGVGELTGSFSCIVTELGPYRYEALPVVECKRMADPDMEKRVADFLLSLFGPQK